MLVTKSLLLVALALASSLAGCDLDRIAAALEGKKGAPAAKTPRACVEGLIAAREKEDLAGVARYIVDPVGPKVTKLAAAFGAIQGATKKLATAAEARFGKDAAEELGLDDGPRGHGQFAILEVKEDGDRATVRLKETSAAGRVEEETLTLVKKGGGWYFQPAKDDPLFGDAELAMVDKLHASALKVAPKIEALAKEVSSGKVATKDALRKKYFELLKEIDAGA